MNFIPKGYFVGQGFFGFLPDDRKMLFPTQEEYFEYFSELIESWRDSTTKSKSLNALATAIGMTNISSPLFVTSLRAEIYRKYTLLSHKKRTVWRTERYTVRFLWIKAISLMPFA